MVPNLGAGLCHDHADDLDDQRHLQEDRHTVAQTFGFDIYTDGTNYYTQSGGAPGGSGSFNTVTFGASSTIGGTLAGGTTAATIALNRRASGNLILGTADQSGGVYLGGGATTGSVMPASSGCLPGTGTIVNQFVDTFLTATGKYGPELPGWRFALRKLSALGAVFGTKRHTGIDQL